MDSVVLQHVFLQVLKLPPSVLHTVTGAGFLPSTLVVLYRYNSTTALYLSSCICHWFWVLMASLTLGCQMSYM